MRSTQSGSRTRLWLSAADTFLWARRPGASWPGSQLSGHRVFAEFEANGDLVDWRIDGRFPWREGDLDITEFNAICSNFLAQRYGVDYPAVRS